MPAKNVEYIIGLRDRFSGKMDKVSGKARAMDSRMKGLGKSALALGGALGIAFGAAALARGAIDTVVKFDKEMTTLKSITGLASEEMAFFSKSARSMSGQLNTSSADIVAAFTRVGSAQPELLKNKEALAEVTKQALILAKAAGIEGVAGADALTSAMNQFGAEAKDAARFTDILATSQQKGSSIIADTAEALKNSGAAAKAAGVSFETTNAAIQALAKGGIRGAEAGTKLRGVLSKLASQNDKKINPSIVGLSATVTELKKRNLSLADAVKLVGLESATGLLTLIDQNAIFQELDGTLNEVGNAMSQAEINMGSLDEKAKGLSVSWENLILSFEDGTGSMAKTASQAAIVGSAILDLIANLNNQESATFGLVDAGLDMLESQGLITEELRKTGQALTEHIPFLEANKKALNILKDEFNKGAISIKEYKKEIQKLKGAFDELEKKRALAKETPEERQARRLKEIQDARKKSDAERVAKEKKEALKRLNDLKREEGKILSLNKITQLLSVQRTKLGKAALGSKEFKEAQAEIKRLQELRGTATGKQAPGVTRITSAAPKVFNITVEKLVEMITINPQTFKEGLTEVKDGVTEALLAALTDTQTAQTAG